MVAPKTLCQCVTCFNAQAATWLVETSLFFICQRKTKTEIRSVDQTKSKEMSDGIEIVWTLSSVRIRFTLKK